MTISPSVTLATGAVIFRGNEVLLIQRGRPPFLGHWSIPGGKIDYAEPVEMALHREVREETGVEIEILGLVDVFEALPENPGDPHFVMVDYAARYVSGDLEAGDDAMDAAFVPVPEALARLAWDKTRLAVQRALPYINGTRTARS